MVSCDYFYLALAWVFSLMLVFRHSWRGVSQRGGFLASCLLSVVFAYSIIGIAPLVAFACPSVLLSHGCIDTLDFGYVLSLPVILIFCILSVAFRHDFRHDAVSRSCW
jgi:hypothetical protein